MGSGGSSSQGCARSGLVILYRIGRIKYFMHLNPGTGGTQLANIGSSPSLRPPSRDEHDISYNEDELRTSAVTMSVV